MDIATTMLEYPLPSNTMDKSAIPLNNTITANVTMYGELAILECIGLLAINGLWNSVHHFLTTNVKTFNEQNSDTSKVIYALCSVT